MKKALAVLAAVCAVGVAYACWFTESNFNATYIASVNSKVVHYTPASTLAEATYHNGQSADLPLTVQVKVSPRFGDQPGESAGAKPITTASLQYKVVRAGGTGSGFVTVKTITNPAWAMDFSVPVNLFGSDGVIDIPDSQISAGDDIIIRVWMSDGTYHTGDKNADLAVSDVPDTQTASSITCGLDGWQAPHVFRVKWSGKRRVRVR